MDYYGLLFLYYLKGLSGKSILRLFFNIEAGGTEQLLPENTLTPTTTPILADIQYPDGLRTDQYFTYRETPTTVSNKARIKTIKGNTLVWNQLINTVVSKTEDGITTSFDSSTGLFSIKNDSRTTNFSSGSNSNTLVAHANCVVGHKYLINVDKNIQGVTVHTGTYQAKLPTVLTYNGTGGFYIRVTWLYDFVSAHPIGDVTSFHIYIVDLTQMGLDSITSVDEFASLFPLPYYAYDSGSLLSFNGNGIKTTGKNLNPWTGVDYIASTSRTVFLKKGDYVFSTDNGNNFEGSTQIYICLADSNGNNITSGGITSGYLSLNDSVTFYYGGYGRNNIPFTLNFDAFVSFGFNNQRPTNFSAVQLEFGSVATDYEPYTSSTLSLPISTYFPTGMKSAGSIHDELMPKRAITNANILNLGNLTWTRTATQTSGVYRFIGSGLPSDIKLPANNGIIANMTSIYKSETVDRVYNGIAPDMSISLSAQATFHIRNDKYITAEDFKSAMDGIYVCYEVKTPIETPITTEDANEALSLLMGKSVSSDNAKQMIDIITKGE